VPLVVRDGRTLVPEDRTVLRHGDDVLVVTPRRAREATEDRLHAVSDRGRLADWLDGPGGG
jgi:cell volume regulation protein A